MRKQTRKDTGFTLIELLLYIGIVSIVLTAVVLFSWDIIYGRVRSTIQLEVNQNSRLVAERITYEIRNASGIQSLSSNELILNHDDSSRNPTRIILSSETIFLGYGSTGDCPQNDPCPLTSDSVRASSLEFTDFSSGDSSHIHFSFTIEHNNDGYQQAWEESQSYETSVELRSL